MNPQLHTIVTVCMNRIHDGNGAVLVVSRPSQRP
jgi:hypothetical protein